MRLIRPPLDRKKFVLLSILLLLVCILTLAYAFGFRIQPKVDARWYDTIAWNLARGKGFRMTDAGSPADDPAIAVVGPGYPYFLAGVYRIFGHRLEPVWIIHSLLHALNALLVFILALRILPDSERRFALALLAAALYGLNPDLIQIAAMLFTETLYLTLLLAAALGMAAFADNPSAKTAIPAAVLLACAVLVRPVALVPAGIFLILIAIKKKWVLLPAAALILALLVGVWTAHNYSVYGRFILLTAAGGYDLWVGNNPDSLGEQLVTPEINEYLAVHGTLETDRHGMQEYANYMLSDPAGFLVLQAVKAAKFFSVIRTSGWWFHLSGTATAVTIALSAPLYFLLLLLGGPGICSSLRKGPAAAKIFSWTALSVPALVIPITVTSRLRYPMYPFLAVLGVLAIDRYRRGGISKRSFLFCAAGILAATAADIIISWPIIRERMHLLFP
jgi:hypothetical protein